MNADNLLPHPSRVRVWSAALVGLLFLLSGREIVAQLPPAPAEDASVLLPGLLRFSLTTYWERYDRVSGYSPAAGSEPLGAPYSFQMVGVQALPSLTAVQNDLAALGGSPAYQLSLGTTNLRAEVLRTITPVAAELGLTRRISLTAALPIIGASGETVLDVNPLQTEGNAGFNPALSVEAARNSNITIRNQITAASSTLEQLLTSCMTTPTGPGCATLLPRAAEAQALINDSRAFRNTMERVFGSDTVTGSPFVPVQGSAIAEAIASRLAAFNNVYRELLSLEMGAPDPLGARPFNAQTALTATQFRNYLELADFGIGITPLLSWRRQGIGDIEIGARFQLVDSFQDSDSAVRGVRAALSVLGRLPTGSPPSPTVAFDVGTGDGQLDVEFGGVLDLQLTRSLGFSGGARLGLQLPGQLEVRVAPPGTAFAGLDTQRDVERDPGDYLSINLRPRINLGPYVTFTGIFDRYSKQRDSYTELGQAPALLPAADILNVGTDISITRAGLGIRVSNASRNGAAEPRMPLEFSAMYLEQISSSGYGVPDAALMALQLRVRFRIFGN